MATIRLPVGIYVIIRLIYLILSAVLLVTAILELIRQMKLTSYDPTQVSSLIISIVVLFVGCYGSLKNDRRLLFTFALIMIICIILSGFAQVIVYTSLGTSISLVVLSLLQAELINRGFH